MDRILQKLYTLVVDDQFNSVVCDSLTGLKSGAESEVPMHFSLLDQGLPIYGQVNHYSDTSTTQTYKAIDEIMYVVHQAEIYR